MAKEYSFEKLLVWQDSRKLVTIIYIPSDELFSLKNQMRRALISISSNIAENCKASQAQFYISAYNSMIKSLNQLIISKNMNYIDGSTLSNIREIIDSIASKLSPAKQFKYS